VGESFSDAETRYNNMSLPVSSVPPKTGKLGTNSRYGELRI